MKFHLRIYDSFNFMEELEAHNHGQYKTYKKAMVAAKAIIERFFEENWKIGMTAKDLFVQYCIYGGDPTIVPNEPGEHQRFSARTYAEEIHETIFKKLQGSR